MDSVSHSSLPIESKLGSSSRSLQTWAIAIVMFIMGGCGMAYEYTLSKIASDILGNSVQQWAIVIAVMLFCMGLGAEIQKHIPDRKVVDTLAYSQIALALLGGFSSLLMLHVFSALPSHFVLTQYLLVSAIGILIGFEIPLLTRINEQFSSDVKSNLARILKMDYIGALIGALIWVFFLFRTFSMVQTGLILSLTTLLACLLFVAAFRDRVQKASRLYVCLLLAAAAIGIGFAFEKDWTATAEQRLYRDRIIFSTTTKYQHIVLTENRAGVMSCFINGHLQFNGYDEHIYHEHLVHPAMSIAPRRDRVLILGGGDGLALREVLKYDDVGQVTLVDLDPVMTELARDNEHFLKLNHGSLRSSKVSTIANTAFQTDASLQIQRIAQSGGIDQNQTLNLPPVQVINVDAAEFVAQAPGLYDVIIIDFPDPNSVELAKLYSQHFYGFLRQKLSADGIFAQQSTSPYHAKEAFLCIGRTMQSAGLAVAPYHDNVPSFGEWGWWIGGRDSHQSADGIRQRLRSIPSLTAPTRYLTPEIVEASLVFAKNQLHTDRTEVNTITNPCIYTFYLDAWKETRGIL
ncbi:polyamine aminopropyltransferase [Pelagicoccus sp. SDUM812003]|uniref:polyamine aminopropyltransferase n=1 Tax=Pelagicoccus sp. SDUM812003 TaxID=3041267 RepID=UPI00280EE7B7|nr:polyamine aminopropyltransferase [Pelagicoccus sp. SDUM812003]MDQ8204202.1 polyamine aminopropyltransferase [Pelagicoccus sp. SDUM812003]